MKGEVRRDAFRLLYSEAIKAKIKKPLRFGLFRFTAWRNKAVLLYLPICGFHTLFSTIHSLIYQSQMFNTFLGKKNRKKVLASKGNQKH